MSKLTEQIEKVEGFKVKISNPRRKRIAGTYNYKRQMPGRHTVSQFIRTRLSDLDEGVTITVVDGNGQEVHGRKVLKNLRESYV